MMSGEPKRRKLGDDVKLLEKYGDTGGEGWYPELQAPVRRRLKLVFKQEIGRDIYIRPQDVMLYHLPAPVSRDELREDYSRFGQVSIEILGPSRCVQNANSAILHFEREEEAAEAMLQAIAWWRERKYFHLPTYVEVNTGGPARFSTRNIYLVKEEPPAKLAVCPPPSFILKMPPKIDNTVPTPPAPRKGLRETYVPPSKPEMKGSGLEMGADEEKKADVHTVFKPTQRWSMVTPVEHQNSVSCLAPGNVRPPTPPLPSGLSSLVDDGVHGNVPFNQPALNLDDLVQANSPVVKPHVDQDNGSDGCDGSDSSVIFIEDSPESPPVSFQVVVPPTAPAPVYDLSKDPRKRSRPADLGDPQFAHQMKKTSYEDRPPSADCAPPTPASPPSFQESLPAPSTSYSMPGFPDFPWNQHDPHQIREDFSRWSGHMELSSDPATHKPVYFGPHPNYYTITQDGRLILAERAEQITSKQCIARSIWDLDEEQRAALGWEEIRVIRWKVKSLARHTWTANNRIMAYPIYRSGRG